VHGDGVLTRYNASLEVPTQVAAEVALLKAMAVRYVMSDPARLAMQAEQRDLITDLAGRLMERPTLLDPAFRPVFAAASSYAARLRVVVDQVALLTDAQAVAWHRASA
jgi:dGTPase